MITNPSKRLTVSMKSLLQGIQKSLPQGVQKSLPQGVPADL